MSLRVAVQESTALERNAPGCVRSVPLKETNMSTPKERLLDWLRDAYAMEEQAETMLSGQAQRIKNYPELKTKIEEHLKETQVQAQAIKACIARLGGSTSAIKAASGKMMAMGQALSGMFVDDEVVKGSMANYTFEHMEIASYRVLIAAAEEAGETTTKSVCQKILTEEERMATWLEEHLAGVTRQFLQRDLAGATTADR
jgi:ferritin-like metal-binding protein YciE